jgi:hypothetical protein
MKNARIAERFYVSEVLENFRLLWGSPLGKICKFQNNAMSSDQIHHTSSSNFVCRSFEPPSASPSIKRITCGRYYLFGGTSNYLIRQIETGAVSRR